VSGWTIDYRLEMLVDAIPNLRSVSVSGWTNFGRAAEMLGKKYGPFHNNCNIGIARDG
jgi:hypothetical protein